MPTTRLLDLGDELLAMIAEQLPVRGPGQATSPPSGGAPAAVLDLLHLRRTCQRWCAVVSCQCDGVWKQLLTSTFPTSGQALPPPKDGMQAFKLRYEENSRRLRLERRVALLKLRSDIQTAQHEVSKAEAGLAQERSRQQQIQTETRALEQASRIRTASASQAWVPSAVRQSWDVVIEQLPNSIGVDARLEQLRLDLKASRVQEGVLQQQILSRRSQLQGLKRQLRVLEAG